MVRTRTYVLAFVAGALVIGAVAWFAITATHRRVVAETSSILTETAENRATLIGFWIAERRADAAVTAIRPLVRALFEPAGPGARMLAADFDSIAAHYDYDAVTLVRPDGASVASGSRRVRLTDTVRSFVRAAVATGESDVRMHGAPSDSAQLMIVAPVRSTDGRPLGVLLMEISPYRRLFPVIMRQTGRLRRAEALLAEVTPERATLIARVVHGAPQPIQPQLRFDTAGAPRTRLFREGRGFERYEDYSGVTVYAGAARVPGTRWVILIKLPVRDALAEFHRAERLHLVAAGLALVALALGLLVLARRAGAEERRRSAALAASERRLTDLLRAVEMLAVVTDREGRIVFVNDTLVELLGRPREALLGNDAVGALLPAGLQEGARERLVTGLASGEVPSRFEAKVETPAGTRRVLWHSTVLRDPAGVSEGLAAIGEDVTAVREMEDALRQSEERYRALVEGARDLIFSLDLQGRIVTLNPAFETMTGFRRDAWIGRPFLDVIAEESRPDARQAFERVVRTDQRPTSLFRVLTSEGPTRIGEFTGTPQLKNGHVVGLLGVCRDVTERATLEQQLRQSSRMEAVGQLAGGIAHDFNNLLTVIIGSTELMLSDMPADSPWRADAQEIRASAARAAMLTRQLLAFSRRQMLAPRRIDLNSLVTGAVGMLRRLIGEHIALEVKLDPSPGAVRADPGQLEQVIVNLAVNARDAMPSGGRLTVATTTLRNDAPVSVGAAEVPPGEWAVIEVRDTGTGMTPDVLAHAFEPFFTTKPQGKGTGLGLASAYGVIKQSQGFIGVESTPGAGTTFRIYLPHTTDPAEPEPAAAARKAPPRGSETVLLVEDELTVRAVARVALTRQGYRVLEAAGGQEALSLTATGTGTIDLLLTDVVMPGMSGPELAERLTGRRPGLRVLYMSGYTDEAVVKEGRLARGAPLLVKPFTPEDLARKVREVLDRPA
jgi:two-component system, cell cycle sensor histidine kinase and response regulator CckA